MSHFNANIKSKSSAAPSVPERSASKSPTPQSQSEGVFKGLFEPIRARSFALTESRSSESLSFIASLVPPFILSHAKLPPKASNPSSSASSAASSSSSQLPPKKAAPAGSKDADFNIHTTGSPRAALDPESLLPCVDLQAHEKEMYLSLFEQADLDRDGYVSSTEAVEFLRKSDLGNNELAEIWNAVHVNNSKKLNRNAFATAVRLVCLAQEGKPISIDQINRTKVFKPPRFKGISLYKSSAAPPPKTASSSSAPQQPQSQSAQPNPSASGFNWVITESYAAYCHSIFMSIQKKNPIILDGAEARAYLMQAGLSVNDLALIWELSDVNKDGSLTEPEFGLALFLIQARLAQQNLPTKLPQSLLESYNNPVGPRSQAIRSRGGSISLSGSAAASADDQTNADDLKALADEMFNTSDFSAADLYYTRAVDKQLAELASTLRRRAASRFALGHTAMALEDCATALQYRPTYAMGHVTRGLFYLSMGKFAEAEKDIQASLHLDPKNLNIIQTLEQIKTAKGLAKEAEAAIKSDDMTKAQEKYRALIEICPRSLDALLGFVDLLIKTKQYKDASFALMTAQQIEPNNKRVLWANAQISFFTANDIDSAASAITAILASDPSHKEALELQKNVTKLQELRKKGNSLFAQGTHDEAITVYTEAIAVQPISDGFKAILYANRAAAYKSLHKLDEAVADLGESLQLDPTYAKAYLRRGLCYIELEMWDEAVTDFSMASTRDPFNLEIASQLRESQAKQAQQKHKDYYEILGLKHDASSADIKRAYKIMALKHHPDKTASSGTSALKAEKVFKDISTAYAVLNDAEQKEKYDKEWTEWSAFQKNQK